MEEFKTSKPKFCYGYSNAIDKYFIEDSRTRKQMKFTKKEIKELISCFVDLLKSEGDEKE